MKIENINIKLAKNESIDIVLEDGTGITIANPIFIAIDDNERGFQILPTEKLKEIELQ